MLTITIPSAEQFDPVSGMFHKTQEQVLNLEHSLLSISKWEAKWKKPFISNKPMTSKEMIDYIRCMTISKNVDPLVYNNLTQKEINQIVDYIGSDMTATTFSNNAIGKASKERITSEIIYYWMVAYNIPFECQKWHLNRLITLIRVAGIKNAPPKKANKSSTAARYKAINAQRRAKYHTKG